MKPQSSQKFLLFCTLCVVIVSSLSLHYEPQSHSPSPVRKTRQFFLFLPIKTGYPAILFPGLAQQQMFEFSEGIGVQRQREPCSIKSSDKLAMAARPPNNFKSKLLRAGQGAVQSRERLAIR
jgi:hypothetical protein